MCTYWGQFGGSMQHAVDQNSKLQCARQGFIYLDLCSNIKRDQKSGPLTDLKPNPFFNPIIPFRFPWLCRPINILQPAPRGYSLWRMLRPQQAEVLDHQIIHSFIFSTHYNIREGERERKFKDHFPPISKPRQTFIIHSLILHSIRLYQRDTAPFIPI